MSYFGAIRALALQNVSGGHCSGTSVGKSRNWGIGQAVSDWLVSTCACTRRMRKDSRSWSVPVHPT